MRGEIIGVWRATWSEIWSKLERHKDAPDDLFCELYRELVDALIEKPDVTSLADIVDDPAQSRTIFMKTKTEAFKGEIALIEFMEQAHLILQDLGDDPLANRYFLLVEKFLQKYSLRYDLRRPFTLHPTLPGVFARLIRDLKIATDDDVVLRPLMIDFEECIRDLRNDRSSGRIKSCIQKQINLLEAIGKKCPGVTTNTLGQICEQVGTWPHAKIKQSMKDLYGFASDYPGIRHAGTPANALRDIDMRDLIAVTVMLAGFSPYLTDLIEPDSIYRGS